MLVWDTSPEALDQLYASIVLAEDESGAQNLPLIQVSASFLIIIGEAVAAYYLEVGCAGDLFVAGIRAFVQLNLLGVILYPIFKADNPLVVMCYIFLFMIFVSAYEAAARPKVVYPSIFRNCVATLGGSLLCMGCVLMMIVAPTPWYNAQYLIPLAGMLINNALTGTAQALNLMLDFLTTRKDHIEILLAFGATPWEACWPGYATTFKNALIPAINGMNVIGLVSIPGMMTGQVLGGSSPTKAARYQIVITFLISGTTFLSVGLINGMTIRSLFDSRGRLASDTRCSPQSRMRIGQFFSPAAWKKSKKKPDALLSDVATGEVPLVLQKVADGNGAQGAGDPVLKLSISGEIARKRPVKVDLDAKPGQVTCIMGPSGIGKTTVLKFISDLTEAEGAMSLREKPASITQVTQWRRDVLYVHQGKADLPGTPRDMCRSIEKLGVNKGRAKLEPGPIMEEWGVSADKIDQQWSTLSGGEKQRIMIAIAVATGPSVILLDEPTSALDEKAKQLVEAKLKTLSCAVICVTHDRAQANRIAHAVYELVPQ
mmetsp:Transcript_15639/g.37650  ORF Transcript_15639/g.37650 Transcript_15639/m.37650 type:complete len:543 (+) Transcript_15639:53-1681(+)